MKSSIKRPLAMLEAARTANQFHAFMTAAAFAAGSGASRRLSRMHSGINDAELSTVRNMTQSADVWQAAERQVDLVAFLADEWREEMANAAQIYLMTCADVQYWSSRLFSSWAEAWLAKPAH